MKISYQWTPRRTSFATSYIFFGTIFFGLWLLVNFELAIGVLVIIALGHLVWLGEDKYNKQKADNPSWIGIGIFAVALLVVITAILGFILKLIFQNYPLLFSLNY